MLYTLDRRTGETQFFEDEKETLDYVMQQSGFCTIYSIDGSKVPLSILKKKVERNNHGTVHRFQRPNRRTYGI